MPEHNEQPPQGQNTNNNSTGNISGKAAQSQTHNGHNYFGGDLKLPPGWGTKLALIALIVTFIPAMALVAVMLNTDGDTPTLLVGATATGMAYVIIAWLMWKKTHESDPSQTVLRRLRKQVHTQWSNEASKRDTQSPRPLRLRWRPTSEAVERAYSDGERPDAKLMRGELVQAIDERSPAHALAAAFRDMSRRQLVVLGPPGAGKSTLAALFALALIEQDAVDGPVPVLLSVAGWDPSEPIEDWCLRRIAENYPRLGMKGFLGRNRGRDLLERQRIIPMLDGLDEMRPEVLDVALRGIDRAGRDGLRMVLTCRSMEFGQAVHEHGNLMHAAVIDIEPLRVEDIAAYLDKPDASGLNRWRSVIASMRNDPDGPLAQALSTPLMISLARTIYKPPSKNPEYLTTFKTKPDITNHLLASYLPTVLSGKKYEKAPHWLSFLSHYLQEQGGDPNFEWWNLAKAVPRWVLFVPIVLVPALCGSLLAGLFLAVEASESSDRVRVVDLAGIATVGAIAGATVGILGGLRIWRATDSPKKLSPHRSWFGIFRDSLSDIRALLVFFLSLSTLAILGLGIVNPGASIDASFTIIRELEETRKYETYEWLPVALTSASVFLVVLVINSLDFRANDPKRSTLSAHQLLPSLAMGMTWGLLCTALLLGLLWASGEFNYEFENATDYDLEVAALLSLMVVIIGIPLGVGRWQAERVEVHKASSPASSLRSDRTALLVAALFSGATPALGLVFFLFSKIIDNDQSPAANMTYGALLGLAIMAVIVAGSGSAWLAYSAARMWLAARGRIPWFLMGFLNRAYEKDVLREFGSSYQLRHEMLRVHLAERWTSDTGTPRSRNLFPIRICFFQRLRELRNARRSGLTSLAAALVIFMGTTGVFYSNHPAFLIAISADDVEFSPDGRVVAVVVGSEIRLWDVESKDNIYTFHIDGSVVADMTFSPGSTHLATVNDDGNVHLVNTTTHKETPLLRTGQVDWVDSVYSLRFSPDGTTLATVNDDGNVHLVNTTTHKETPLPHTGQV
ncbi:hypothetical protein ACFVWN_06550, partial [Nocardiopsis flavescens]